MTVAKMSVAELERFLHRDRIATIALDFPEDFGVSHALPPWPTIKRAIAP
ncbi:MAG: hypothetical protein JOY90_35605 [Bradyrhizobium sp.]|nr:hypothetical protein [Bradyrhizobium sp.]MBV9565742.1 hypothetical protein [Bradyrhizobium sp.]